MPAPSMLASQVTMASAIASVDNAAAPSSAEGPGGPDTPCVRGKGEGKGMCAFSVWMIIKRRS